MKKPKVKMKRLVELMDQCIYKGHCTGCPYDDGSQFTAKCRNAMLQDAHYYLAQTLKNRKERND